MSLSNAKTGGTINCRASAIISNMKPSAKNTLFLLTHNRRRATLIVILVIMAVGIAGLFYNKSVVDRRLEQAVEADKVKFAAVEQDMAAAWSPIDNAAQPQKICYYTSQKYSEGTLRCQVEYVLVTSNPKEGIDNAISGISQYGRYSILADAASVATVGYEKMIDVDYERDAECRLGNRSSDQQLSNEVYFRCSSVTIRPVYPLAQ